MAAKQPSLHPILGRHERDLLYIPRRWPLLGNEPKLQVFDVQVHERQPRDKETITLHF
jgi:hypothetical protein